MFSLFRDPELSLAEKQALDMAKGIEPDYRFLFPFRVHDLDLDRSFPRPPMKRVSDWLDRNTVGLWKYVYTHAADPKSTRDLWGVAFTAGEDAHRYAETFDVAVSHPSVPMANFDPRLLSGDEAEPHRQALAARTGNRTVPRRLTFTPVPPAAASLRPGETAAQRLKALPSMVGQRVPPITPDSLTAI
jgi:hypothetical protein